MTARERLATAMFDGLDMDDAREGARLMVTADPHLAQDIEDGAALRRLREALPDCTVTVTPPWTRRDTGETLLGVGVEKKRPFRVGSSLYIRRWGEGSTIAEAADACREAIEAQR